MRHLVVVGAGIIGLSCAWAARKRGFTVTVVDPDFEGDRASHGNAGGIAVSECVPLSLAGMGLKPLRWLLDPLGPLAIRPGHAPRLLPWYLALRKVGDPGNYARIGDALASLNRLCLADFEAMLGDLDLSGDLHKRGALTVYETDAAYADERASWQFKRERGVRWRPVDLAELRELEPGLAPVFRHAVMLEDWAHIDDPKRIVDVLRQKLRERGVEFVRGEAARIEGNAVCTSDGRQVTGDKLLVAAGAWSARLAGTVGDRALVESERGYNTTLPRSVGRLNREVIFAERMFVATPLAIGLRIGGAAEFAGLEAAPNFKRSDALLQLARRYLPDLQDADARQWMGNRPTTPDSLPVLGLSPRHPDVLYAFGHGHLGLTQSATTAALIAQLLVNERPSVDLAPFTIARF
ncbi:MULTISPECIES: FAD-binding oxidoreductase [unclassified Achromobacter]|uniref:NAD(P)/FAD-dependent oxidoreductase n=1 Tax=unclassified Achromobacter TaxID=2626865 RepID=UPI000B51BA72|nr:MULTISPECIES: FAD-binding oxidoreductase [unclassified Achromobacter]OWT72781.1 amino acid dehydrogenase [Achromobacter sp. HZ34]OWT74000.1 amino acid dehydrogenase [Achromobacter sp. HZ28]